MKSVLIILVHLILFVSCTASEPQIKPQTTVFEIKRGVNIAYFLSQNTHRGEKRARYFTADDIKRIKEYGFDHIRLPIDEEQMFKEDGSKDAQAFDLLKWTVDYSIKAGLKVVVDMHILRSHHFTSGSNTLFTDVEKQEAFYEMWRQISGELHSFPNSMLAYELLNEPQARKKEDWNNLVRNCYEAIRELEPERVIVIGTNPSQSYTGAKYLEIPKNDRNIIISFHYYEPFLLTHYRARWTSQKDFDGPVHYPGVTISKEEFDNADCDAASKNAVIGYVGQFYDRAVFRKHVREVMDIASEYGLQVYCGEYGCLPSPPEKDRLQWHSDIETVFDQFGIARSIWCYKDSKDGFGIIKDGIPDDAMLEAIYMK